MWKMACILRYASWPGCSRNLRGQILAGGPTLDTPSLAQQCEIKTETQNKHQPDPGNSLQDARHGAPAIRATIVRRLRICIDLFLGITMTTMLQSEASRWLMSTNPQYIFVTVGSRDFGV
jgi:hypothetical protein